MIRAIRTFSEAGAYQFSTELDGENYLFDFAWNERDDRWFLTISDETEEVIVGSVPVELGQDMLGPYVSVTLPPGVLYAWDQFGKYLEPDREELGARVLLLYADAEEVAS